MEHTSDLFYDHASIDYPILDCDAHVNEPPDTWVGRVPTKYKDRAPKVVHRDDGDYWSFNDGESVRPVGLTATAGLSFLDFAPVGVSYESMRPGSFDTKARLADMDIDGMYLQVLYPSVTLLGAKIYGSEPELQVACVRAYNDWLAEFCEGSDGRLIGQGILPTTGVDDTVAEMKRCQDLGHRGVVISAYPNGSLEPAPEDDAFWALAQETDTPVAVHIGSFLPTTGTSRTGPTMNTPQFMGMARGDEVGLAHAAGGLPTAVLRRVRTVHRHQAPARGVEHRVDPHAARAGRRHVLPLPVLHERRGHAATPSRIFHRNFWASFMIDTVGMDLRHRLNVDQLMWSTDYPHTGSDWPNSRVTIERNFRGVPKAEVKKMLHDNCRRLYKLDHVPETLTDT